MGIVFSAMIIFFPGFDLLREFFYARPTLSINGQSSQDLNNDMPVESIRDIVSSEGAIPSVDETGFGLPVRLKIPEINVDAIFEYVSLTADGAMDVPKDIANVAWFDIGPRPGENNSAVIAGHYGWKNGKASVFNDLYKLQSGDKLFVEDEKGTTIVFVVRESRRFDPDADASGVFGSSDGKAHLNLITCEGTWDKVSKSYPKRLVVFADKE